MKLVVLDTISLFKRPVEGVQELKNVIGYFMTGKYTSKVHLQLILTPCFSLMQDDQTRKKIA